MSALATEIVDSTTAARLRCLVELALHAKQYSGGFIQRGDRVTGRYDASHYLGHQPGGAYVWSLGHEDDAADCRDDFMRIVESFGLDCEMSIQPYRDHHVEVWVRFVDDAAVSR